MKNKIWNRGQGNDRQQQQQHTNQTDAGACNGTGKRKKMKEAKPFLSSTSGLPMKKIFRQRAHANPLCDGAFEKPIGPRCVSKVRQTK